MAINISIPDVDPNLRPHITVMGVGGSGGNAVNNMMNSNLEGVDFLIANTDAQALQISKCKKKIQLGVKSTRGLGAGMRPDVGKQAAEEAIDEIIEKLEGSHMLFIAAGMGGGTGTGAAPVIAKLAREKGILTVGVVTKPFHFEGTQRMKLADKGLEELQQFVDTMLTIPNQNLFRIANEKTTFADAFKMADDVLYAGVRGVTDLMVQPGLINLDFSDVKTVMSEMGKAMMGTGEASGDGRAINAAEAAIANPLIDDVSLKGAKGLIINITGGNDITLYEVDEAANRIKEEVDENANIIYGTTCDDRLEGIVRVSIVATGIDANISASSKDVEFHQKISLDNSVYVNKAATVHTPTEDINLAQDNNSLQSNDEIDVNYNHIASDTNEMTKNFNSHSADDFNENEKTLEIENTSENDIVEEKIEERLVHENNNEELEIDEETHNSIFNESNTQIDNMNSVTATDLQKNQDNSMDSTHSSVRRLSLFDTLEASMSNEKDVSKVEERKSEPTFDSVSIEEKIESNEQNNEIEYSDDQNFDNDEINQESDEDLLDIPTFLRRQAN